MNARRKAAGCCAQERLFGIGLCVTAIDAHERAVERTFQSIFNQDKFFSGKADQIVEQCVGHTVGTRPDNEPDHTGAGKCLFVSVYQRREFVIGVCVGLKIGNVLHVRIFAGKESDTFLQLLRDAFLRLAVGRVECLVVTIGTTAESFAPVPVGTAESGIDGYFLHLARQFLP